MTSYPTPSNPDQLVNFDHPSELKVAFRSIQAHALACGIPVVSQRLDPQGPSRWIAVYDVYLGVMSRISRDLWELPANLRPLPSDLPTQTFIPRDVFAQRFRSWVFPDPAGKVTVGQLAVIHLAAEGAMGGLISLAAKRHPRGHLLAEAILDASLDASVGDLLINCPTYDLTAVASEEELVDYLISSPGWSNPGLTIQGRESHSTIPLCLSLDPDELARTLASRVVLDPDYGLTGESLEVFWTPEFQGFVCRDLSVKVSVTQVTWKLPGLTLTTPNNENFKYFVAHLARRGL